MSVIEIVLIVVGVGILIVGYLLPAGKKDTDEEVQLISEAEIRKLVEGEAETVRERVSEIVDETIGYSIEKTERAMERVANEKIMAVNEYSDTVLEEINKNHKEVTFLYDMLNDKHDTLMTSIGQAAQAADEIRQTIRDAEITADETVKKAKSAEDAAETAVRRIRGAELSAKEAQEAVQEAVESVMGAVEDTRTDLWSLHSAGDYAPEVVEEVESFMDQAYDEPPIAEPAFAEPEEALFSEEAYEPEEVPFAPIKARRVEIIHEPEADYVAEEPDISASEAFAELGIFGNNSASGTAKEEPRGVDIRFAKGPGDGHNSNERILELHKAGKSNMAIAKELGLGLGEVKLVIDLFEGV
ncbi:MAG: DUF6115 domain-containing protein [Bacteroidales bacterium]|nr:DUF6115 domain-containing protein [Bacteroidales bacterium]MCM1415598.1 DUF6115 domain-containing protein [bacterium]MCM1422991.1 DUF6115 domain-containing protein [bacterium]